MTVSHTVLKIRSDSTKFFIKFNISYVISSHSYGISSDINEVIRAVLNFFFYQKILHAQIAQKEHKAQKAQKAPKSTISTKKHQKHQKTQKSQKHNQAKSQNANKRTKIKNALKKHLSGKK